MVSLMVRVVVSLEVSLFVSLEVIMVVNVLLCYWNIEYMIIWCMIIPVRGGEVVGMVGMMVMRGNDGGGEGWWWCW